MNIFSIFPENTPIVCLVFLDSHAVTNGRSCSTAFLSSSSSKRPADDVVCWGRTAADRGHRRRNKRKCFYLLKKKHTRTPTPTHTGIVITTNDLIFLGCVLVFVCTSDAMFVCMTSEYTHKHKHMVNEDKHHVIGWTEDTHVLQPTGDVITIKSNIFSYFLLYHKTKVWL